MFDVIVIGGGPAGMSAALRSLDLGKKVAVVERKRIGGVSTNEGCVPVRALAHAARLMRESEQFSTYGLHADRPTVNIQEVLSRAQEVVDQIQEKKNLIGQLEELGGQVYTNVGDAKFVDDRTIALGDGTQLQAEKFIICAGGHSRQIKFPGSEYALGFNDIWSLKSLPKSLVVVGTGATGSQVASILAAFGTQVTLLDLAPRMLPTEDELLSQVMAEEYEKRGIKVITGISGIKSIEKQDDSLVFNYTHQEQERSIPTEAVFLSVGWPGNVENLNLAAVNVEATDRGYIKVDDYLQTSNPNIFAAGDITGRMMLAQAATHEGRVAAENAVLGCNHLFKHHIVPYGSFTDPEYGSVGMREHQAKAAGRNYVTSAVYYADFVRAVIDNRTAGFCKLIADRDTHEILGAHVVGERAVETVQLVSAGMTTGLKVQQLAQIELAYPTYVAIVGLTARDLVRQLGLNAGEGQWFTHRLVQTGKNLA